MNRLRKGLVLILTGLFCMALFRPAFSQEVVAGQAMTAEQLVSAIGQKWSSVQDFQADMTVNMQMLGKMTKMEGTIWQKDKLLRVEMTLPPEMILQTDKKTAESPKMLMVFDGKIMWQSMPMMNMVIKTDFSKLGDNLKNGPFSKPPYSLPALPYKLSEKQRNGNDYYFLETSDIKEFTQKSSLSGMGANLSNMPFQSIGLWVNKASLFPELIEFYSQKNTPGMSVGFKNIKTDQGFSPDLFVFQAPEGVQVMDMTAAMKGIYEKMGKQSTASDTTQATLVPAKAPEKTSPPPPPPPPDATLK